MKTIKFLFVTLLSVSLFASLSSCGENDVLEPDPLEITVDIQGTPTYYPGEILSFNITVSSGSIMNQLTITPDKDGKDGVGAATVIDLGGASGVATKTYTYTIPTDAVAGKEVKLHFYVSEDGDFGEDYKTYYVVAAPIVVPIVSIFSNIALQVSTGGGSLNSNCASIDGTVYSYNTAKTDVALQAKTDFVMVPIAQNTSKIVAPSEVSSVVNGGLLGWTTKNATKFFAATIAQADYDAITVNADAKITELATGTEVTKIDAATGKIFAFETAAGQKGFAKIVAYNGGSATDWNDATITLEVKVQIKATTVGK